jgi:choline-sulfatase
VALLVREPPRTDTRQTGRPDIVLITIDTLRADRVGRGLTPAIDALAQRGVRFVNARATAPLTLPSHVSIMTGLLAVSHGVRENGAAFKPGQPTLAGTLKGGGYQTAAFVGAFVLDRRFGLAGGFDRYDDRVRRNPDAAERLEAERRGSEVVDAALAWMQSTASPYFLWVHLYDPHVPYAPPPDYLARAGGNAYDGEVAYADAQVGRISAAIGARSVQRSTLIVVAGDHGEGLGEHDERTHGMLAYDSTLRVPLILAGPGADGKGRAIDAPVSLIDVAPTLLRRAGLTPSAAMRGVDLLGPLAADRDVYAETQYPRAAGWHALAALAGERWKLVLSSEAELYDIANDPGERTNVASAHPGIVDGMTSRLRQIEATAAAAPASVDPAVTERLRALGYVSGAGAPPDVSAPNPARVITAWTQFETALALTNSGEPARAIPALQDLAQRFPSSTIFQSAYARARLESGQPREALEIYRAAVARSPRDSVLFHDLAVAARAVGDPAEALRAEQAALALNADNPAALNGLGLLHVDRGRPSEAAAAFERAASLDRTNAAYWTNLGNARRELGDVTAAEAAYRKGLEADATYADALNGLAVVLVQRGAPREAVPLLTRALQQAPDFHEARLNLGIAYQESGELERAADTYRTLLKTAPPAARRERQAAVDLLKQVQRSTGK